jgi:2-dehydropantoate 2-reductase
MDICQHLLTRQIAANLVSEAQTIASKRVIEFRTTLEKRIAVATDPRHL